MNKNDVWFLYVVSMLAMLWVGTINGFNLYQEIHPLVINNTPVIHVEKSETVPFSNMSVIDKIVFYAGVSSVDLGDAFRIVDCESEFGTNLINPGSSARGVYQFTEKTWNHYCTGNVMDEDDNITCFMKLYPNHPEWWECK